jgi:hypothetical protein
MDNPIVFGMVMGGGVATYIRKWFLKRYRKVPHST